MSIINWDLWHLVRERAEKRKHLSKIMDMSIEGQYLQLLKDVLDTGVEKSGRNGATFSTFGRYLHHDMSMSFPLLTSKKMYWKGIVAELLWFLRGDTNIKFLVDNDCHIWNGDAYKRFTYYTDEETSMERFIELIKTDEEFAEKWGDLGPIYGKQWRKWKTEKYKKFFNKWGYEDEKRIYIDQIANLINDLRTNPDSRRLMVNAWNVGELDQMVLPPCHYGFQVYTREMTLYERQKYWAEKNGKSDFWCLKMEHDDFDRIHCPSRKISLLWNQRSADAFLGLPFNIASYALLLSILGEVVNMVPDQLVGHLGDVHIYEEHIPAVKEQLRREMLTPPQLRINTEFWPTESGECGVGPLSSNIDLLIKSMQIEDFTIEGYEPHPAIKAKLIN